MEADQQQQQKKNSYKTEKQKQQDERMKHFCGKVRGWETEGGRNEGRWTQTSKAN